MPEKEAKRFIDGALSVDVSTKLPSLKARNVWRAVYTGTDKQALALRLNTDVAGINRLVRQVDNFLANHVAVDLSTYLAQSHQRLEAIIHESMKSWKKSKGKIVKKTRKFGQDPTDPFNSNPVCLEEVVVEEESAGNPAFLQLAMKAMAEQREMLPGANAPKATAVTNAAGTGDPTLNVDVRQVILSLPMEQQEAIMALANKAMT